MNQTVLTLEQQQRQEALTSAATLLTDRSTSPSSLFTKGADSARKIGAMSAVDTPEAITLAEYIVTGKDYASELMLKLTEDGSIITQKEN